MEKQKRLVSLFLAIMLILTNFNSVLAVNSDNSIITENKAESKSVNETINLEETNLEKEGQNATVDVKTKTNEAPAIKVMATTSYELNIDNGVLLGFKEDREPIEPINLVIPSNVTKIADSAFYSNAMIKSVDFSDVTSVIIGKHAFQKTAIEGELNLQNVKNIDDLAFADNKITSLKNVTVDKLGNQSFRENNLNTINIDAKVIENGVFQFNNLSDATISNVTSMGTEVFVNTNLKKLTLSTIDFPLKVETFKRVGNVVDVVFENTTQVSEDINLYRVNAKEITLNFIDKETGKKIREAIKYLVERDAKPYIISLSNLSLYKLVEGAGYTITDDVIKTENDILNLLYIKNEDVEIIVDPNKRIVYHSAIDIPMEEILKDVYVKTSSGEIKSALNIDGTILKGLTINPTGIKAENNRADIKVNYNYIDPLTQKTTNQTVTFSSKADDIMKQEIGSGWRFEDFVYNGTTLMGLTELGKAKINKGITALKLPGINPNTGDKLTTISNSAFANLGLTNVDFSNMDGLINIGLSSFNNNYIQSLDFSNNTKLNSIGNTAFYNTKIRTVDFSKNTKLSVIGQHAFANSNLESLDLSNTSISNISYGAFSNNKISNLKINEKIIESIEEYAFSNNNLEEIRLINLPLLKRMGYNAFSGEKIKKIHLENLPNLIGEFYTISNNVEVLIYKDLPKLRNVYSVGDNSKMKEITLLGMDSLVYISDNFGKTPDINKPIKFNLGDFPNLETIGNYAFQNYPGVKFPFSNSKKLVSINYGAFLNNKFADLDFTEFKNLTTIESLSFTGASDRALTKLNLVGLQNLINIGYNAFAGNTQNDNDNVAEFTLENLPKLKNISNNAFSYLKIAQLNIKNLPLLESLQGFSNNNYSKLELKDLPSIKTIGDLYTPYLKTINIDLPNLERINHNTFNNCPIEVFHLKAPKLSWIGQNALPLKNAYDAILPETENYIHIEWQGITLNSIFSDFRGKDVKFELSSKDSIYSDDNKLIFDNSNNLKLINNIQMQDNNVLTILIEDNDMNKDGIGDIRSVEDKILVNPQEVEISHYYLGTNGGKVILKTLYYLNTGKIEYTPPVIPGYKLVEEEFKPIEYTNLTINDVKKHEVRYEKLVSKETSYISISAKNVTGYSYNPRYNNANNPGVDIEITNSGSGPDAEYKDLILDVILPDFIDPQSVAGFDPEATGVKILSKDPLTGNLKIKIDVFPGGSTIKLKGGFKFKLNDTPLGYEGPVTAILTNEDGLYMMANTENYSWTYFTPNLYKSSSGGAISYINLIGEVNINYTRTPEIKYAFQTINIDRSLEYVLLKDELPKYTKLDGSEAYAVFEADRNPGWELVEENGVKFAQKRISQMSTYRLGNDLILLFPEAKEFTTVKNNVTAHYIIKNPQYNDKDMVTTTSITDKFVKDRLYPVGNIYKNVDRERVIIEEENSGLIVNWKIGYVNNDYRQYLDNNGNLIKAYDVEAKNIVLKDYMDPSKSKYEDFYAITPDKKAVLSFYKGANGVLQEKIHEVTVNANEEYIIPKEVVGSLETFTISYGDIALKRGESVNAIIKTKVKDYDNIAKVNGSDHNYLNATAERYSGQVKLQDYNFTIYKSLQFGMSNKVVAAKKEQFIQGNNGNTTYNGEQIISYTLKNTEGGGSFTENGITLNDFKQVDVLPKGMEILSIELSTQMKERGGEYTTEELSDGRIKIEFTASKFHVVKYWYGSDVAYIKVKLNKEAKDGLYENMTYLDYSNKDVKADNKVAQELEGGKELSTGRVSFTLRKSEISHAAKLIRKPGSSWQTSIKTKPGEKFQYKLIVNDIGLINKKNISLIDIFPYLGDITLVEAENGIRDIRGSQFANKYIGIESIKVLKDNKIIDAINDFEVKYINTLEGFPKTSSDGSLDDWVNKNIQDTKNENVKGIVLNQKNGLTMVAPYRLEIVINMQTPEFSMETQDEWVNSFAINTFARKDNIQTKYIEANSVENTLEAHTKDILFKKVDDKGNPLKDARFKLIMDGQQDKYAISDDKGNFIFREVPYNPFVVKEVSAPSGYKFSFEEYKSENKVYDPNYVLDLNNPTHTFINEKVVEPINPIYTVNVEKLNQLNAPLQGVKFKLTNVDSALQYEAQTDEKGKISFINLYEGNYILEEISSVNNHTLAESKSFILNEDTPSKTVTLNIVNDKFDVSLVKVGFPYIDRQKPDYQIYKTEGRRLEKVLFELYDGDTNDLISTSTTDSNGEINFKGLVSDKKYYVLEKNTPSGYNKNQEKSYFKVDNQGKVYALVNGVEHPYIDNVILVSNYTEALLSSVLIYKKDQDGNPLDKAVFELLKFEQGKYVRVTTSESGKDGHAKFTEIPRGSYKVREIETKEGYVLSNKEFTFTVDPYVQKIFEYEFINKKTSLDIVKVEKIAGAFDSIELAQEKLNELTKTGEKNLFIKDNIIYKGLSGAEFTLSTIVNGEEVIIEPMSKVGDNDITLYRYESLDANKIYILKETKAPEGYKLLSQDLVLNGKEIFTIETPSYVLLAENKKSLGRLLISKYANETGNLLPGVTFTVYTSEKDAKDNTNVYKTVVTDEQGIGSIKDIPFGTYYVKETAAPHPYSTLDEIKMVKISENNTSVVTTFYNDYLMKNIHVIKKGSDGKLLSGVVFNLYRNNKLVATKESDEKGLILFENLPIIGEYRIEEVSAPKNYKIVEDGKYSLNDIEGYDNEKPLVIVNTKLFDLNVQKVWDDKDNQDGVRPDSVTVKLYANDKDTGKSIVLSKENEWKHTFSDLVEYENEKKIIYSIKEDKVGQGYEISYSGSQEDMLVVTNTRKIDTVNIEGSKTWDDKNNQDGKRPESITIRLLANGEEISSKEVTAENNWKWSFENLDKNRSGELIKYTITEDLVEGYDSTIKGFDATNSYTPSKTKVEVSKIWEDANNKDGIRPEKVTIKLLANGEDTNLTLELSESNNWTNTFTDLDEYKAGKKIVYTIEEISVEGYTSAISGDQSKGYTVTNTHEVVKINVEGSKTWDDKDNQDGKRPESITIRLLANGKEIDSKEVTKESWSWKFENLDKFENGEEIVYTITEDVVEGYSTEVDGHNVFNKYTPGKTSVQVTKAWEDANNQDGVRPESVTVKLLANGEDTNLTLELSESNNWTNTFTDLDEYKAGKKIVYTIEEVDVKNGYESSITGSQEKGYVVTNSRTPDKPINPTPKPNKPVTRPEPKPNPNTGDNFDSMLYIGFASLALVGLVIIGRKKNKETDR